MERKGLFVLVAILSLVGITVGQDDVVRTKASPPSVASDAVLSPLRLASKADASASFEQKKQALANYSRLPLSFERNQGQAAGPVEYLARGAGYNLLLTSRESVLLLQQQRSAEAHDPHGRRPAENAGTAVLRLGFQNANPATTLTGEDELPGKSNYFIGNDPKKWRTGVPNYARVRYHDVYPGIDVLYYGNQSRLEYDFIVAPGVQPQQIGLSIEGAEKLEIDAPTGDLVMQLAGGAVRLRKPLVYQETKGTRREVASAYALEKGQVTFRIGEYDRDLPLVIDPVLTFSTYLGGSADELYISSPNVGGPLINIGIALDANNPPNVYVTGETLSANFPTTVGASYHGSGDVFITEFSSTGTRLVSTFLGGSNEDIPGISGFSGALAVDGSGVYVAGLTLSTDFPTMNPLHTSTCSGDGFVTKLKPTLDALLFSTYVTGNCTASAGSLAVDSGQNIYVTGSAGNGFPTTTGAYQTTCPGASCSRGFVMKLISAPGGVYTLTGGYSTLIGGNGGGAGDNVLSIALDSAASPNAYLSGTTVSADFPITIATAPQPTPPGGGIGVSTNGGSNWTMHLASATTLQFFSVAFNPTTPLTVLAGGANGIYLSSDSGNTWALKLSTNQQVSGIAFDPLSVSTVYAVTRGQGVFVSADGGNTWNPSANTNLTNRNIFALAVDPANNIYVGTNAGVFKSTDGGQTWLLQSTGITDLHIRSLAIDPTTPSTIYAGTATSLFKSVNGASNWLQMSTGLVDSNGNSVSVNALAITPGTTSTLYAGTPAGVFKSTNSGGSWAAMNSGMTTPDGSARNVSSLVVDPMRPSNIYAGTPNRGVYASNAASSWAEMNNGMTLGVSALAILSTSVANPPTLYAATSPNVGFLAKLDPSGASLLASTFWGGNGNSIPSAIAADPSGVYVAGYTNSTNFFTKSPLPGQSTLTGRSNAAVSKLNTSLSSYSYSTYLGGSGVDSAFGVAVDGSGNAWVTGSTSSRDFPLANAVWLQAPEHTSNGSISNEAFVTQINSAGSGLVFSTYLGGRSGASGNPNNAGIGIKVDAAGDAYVMGYTNTNDFPTANASQPASGGGYDAFVTKIGSSATTTDLSICLLNAAGQCIANPTAAVPPCPSQYCATAGASFIVNMQVTNKSATTAATGVVVGGRGGEGLNAIACTVSVGTCNFNSNSTPNGGFANLGTLGPNASAQISITLRGTQAGTFTATLDVRENENDANPADNSVNTTFTIAPGADLAVSASESPTPAQVGQPLTYTATIVNLGPSPASNVTAVVTFTPAAAVTFGSLPTGCSNPPGTGTLNCTIGPLNPGVSSPGDVTVTVNSLPIVATITVSNTPEADPDLTNNTATVTTTSVERFLITDFDNNALRVFDLANNSAHAPIRIGRSGTGVAVSPNRRLAFVGNLNSNYVSVIDLTIGREIARIHNIRAERNLAISRDGSIVVIPDLNTNELVLVDTATFNVIQRVSLSKALGNPAGSDFLGSVVVANNLALANINGLQSNLPVVGVELQTNSTFNINLGVNPSGTGRQTGGIAATPDGTTVLAIRQNPNNLYVINTSGFIPSSFCCFSVQTVALPSAPLAITVVPNPTNGSNTFGFVAHSGPNGPVVSAIDLRKGSATFGQLLANTDVTLTTFTGVRDISSSSDGSRLVVITTGNGTGDNVAVLDATPVRGCSTTPNPACAPPTVLSQVRLGDNQSNFTSVVAAFADTVPPSTAPILNSPVAPPSVPYNAGSTVTITGSNFAASDSMVRFGTGDPVPATVVNPTTITATVPLEAPAGIVDITVTARNASGAIGNQNQSAVLNQALTIIAPANYHPFNQAVVTATGGDEVDILDLKTNPADPTSKVFARVPVAYGLGDRPLSVAITQDGLRAFTTSFAPGNLDFFNLATATQEQQSLSLLGPYGTNGGNIFGQNDAIVPILYPPTGEKAMAVLSSFRTNNSDDVFVVGSDPNVPADFEKTINNFAAGAPAGSSTGGIGATPDGKFLYANDSGGNLVIYNLTNAPTVTTTTIALSTLGKAGVTVSAFQARVYVTPDGNALLLATDQGPIAVLDISSNGTYVPGATRTNPLLIGTTSGSPPAGLSAVFLTSYQVVGTQLFAFDPGDNIVQIFNFLPASKNFSQLPSASFVIPGEIGFLGADLAVTPDGLTIYAVLEGQDETLVLDVNAMLAGTNPIITRLATGVNPIGVAISSTTAAEPDLSVDITANPSAGVLSGDPITYTVKVSNLRNVPATGVTLTTTLSPSLTVNSVSPSQGTCSVGASPVASFTCSLGTLTQGAPATVTIMAIAPASGNATNAFFNFDSDPVGHATPFTDMNAGLSATFTSPADPGGFLVNPTFFSSLTGNVLVDPGPAGQNNLPLTVAFSGDLSSISLNFATNGPGTFSLSAYENGTLVGQTSAVGSVPPGFTYPEGVISFAAAKFNSVVLASTAPDFAVDNIDVTGLHITITSSVTENEIDFNPADNTSSVNTPVLAPVIDLALAKSHTGSFTVGTNGVYTLTVTNVGNTPTTGPITVTDTLPVGLGFVSGTGVGWGCSANGQVVTCTNPGPISGNNGSSTVTLTVSVTAAAVPSVINAASVSTAGDNNPANNSASDPTTVNPAPPADLTITKTHIDPFAQGQAGATYTITVSNVGTGPTSGTVTVSDNLPTGLTATAIGGGSGSNWVCTLQPLGCTRNDPLAAGASYDPITLTVGVAITAPPQVTNVATVSGGGEVNTANDTANDLTNIVAVVAADLGVTMAASPSPVPVLGSVTYQITVTNNGPSPATGVVLTDTLPAGTVFASIVNSADILAPCTVPNGTLTCNFGSLGVGSAQTVNLILVPLAVPAGTGTFGNTATVTANESDPNPSNNSATQTVQVTGTNLPGGGAFRNLPGFSKNILGPNDDSSVGPVPMNLTLNFFGGGPVSSVFVNNNGNVTFDSALATFTPFLLTNTTRQIIAPYFSDVETDFPGSGLVTYGNDTVNGRPAFGVNWPNVEYFGEGPATLLNLFQLVLVDRSDVSAGDFDIEFNYNKIQWETGDASGGSGGFGGSSARAGYSNGSSTSGSFFELPGSGVPGSFLDTNNTTGLIHNSLNNAQPGRYVFPIRGGTVQSSADLAITATPVPSASAGSTITYTLTVTNLGGTAPTATGVTVTNTLPAGFTFVSAGSSNICQQTSPGIVTCNVGSLNSGANANITIQATIPANETGQVIDTAVVSAPNNQDLNLANNSATVVTNFPDLTISKSHSGNFTPGQTGATYTIAVRNLGPGPTSGLVTVSDNLPTGLTATAISGPNWACTLQPLGCTRSDSLAAGARYESITLTVNVAVNAPPLVTNTATVAGGGEGNTANDTANDPTNITQLADLTINKTHTGNFTAGSNGVYTITVTNLGGGATTGLITVTDTLPTGLSFVSGAGAGWSCSANGQVVTCTNPGPIAGNNGTSVMTLTVNVASDASCTVTNTATVSGGGEVNTENDTTADVTNIGDFCVSVAVVQPANGSGTTVTYDVIVTNHSSSDASGLDVKDQLTGNASFASVSSEVMTCPTSSPLPNPIDCTLATLPANTSAAVTIAVQLIGAGWDGNNISVTLQNPPLVLAHNAASLQRPPAGGSTVTGSDVAVQPPDSTTGASPAILTFANVSRGGTTTLASAASGLAPPAGFRTGAPSVFYNFATSAGYSGAIGLALGFNGVSFHHPAKVRLFHSENGAWVDRTVAGNGAGGYAVGLVSSLSPFVLFEPLNQVPVANAGPDSTTAATSSQGAKVTLNGSASSDPDGDPLTYRWTGPFPEGNGVVTGVNPTVTLPPGANRVTLVVNDSEVNSAPASANITITDFSLAAVATGPTTITAGGSASFNITANPQFGPFPAAVTLACLGLPQGAQCNFSSTTVNAGGPAAKLTISTTPRTVAQAAPIRHGNRAPLYALWMPLPAIVLAGLGARRRARKHTVLAMLLLLGVMVLLVSCGGGSMGSPPPVQNGTPAGNYTVTVTGTANGSLQHQTTLSFTVQ